MRGVACLEQEVHDIKKSPSPSSSPPQGTKGIMKDVAKYLPGIGWTFLFMEYPFLNRDWKKDEERLAASCKSLSDYPVNILVSLVLVSLVPRPHLG